MNLVTIEGIQVNFPFKPYDVQKTYMENVIQCLQKGVNGLLESPTGTGKTLCLLCSSLAWLETRKAAIQATQHGILSDSTNYENEDIRSSLAGMLGAAVGNNWNSKSPGNSPKIIYCSRTHSQLSQAIQELKKTSYRHMKATIIASRDQLCINADVKKEESSVIKRQMCMTKVSSRTCIYYNNIQQNSEVSSGLANQQPVSDIEDLISFGNKNRCCPYFMARGLKNTADIIFMPYNYLLDPKTRKRHGIELMNCVIIFDEAHNISSVCEDSTSVNIKSQDVASAITEVTQVMEAVSSVDTAAEFGDSQNSQVPDFTLNDLALLKVLLCEFEEAIDKTGAATTATTKDGNFLYEVLQKIHVTYDKKDAVLELIDKAALYLTTTKVNPFQRKEAALLRFAELIRVVYSKTLSQQNPDSSYNAAHFKCFKIYLQPNENDKKHKRTDLWNVTNKKTNSTTGQGWILNFWCFNPGLSMEDLIAQNVRSIILTSGTLTPLDSFAQELGISFPIKLENPHVVNDDQMWCGVVHSGPDKVILNSTYKNRSSKEYLFSLGRSIVNFTRLIPGGLLVFFPSYRVMEDSVSSWQANDIWKQMNDIKKVFMEPRSQVALNSSMELYYEAIKAEKSRGAIFMAVCRGKVSEGLDFADNFGRAVLITGLPYPPLTDRRVSLKKQYLDEHSIKGSDKKKLTGDYWYQMEATRAVNQAIGRVIRHDKDYGAIILCDERFDYSSRRVFLPSWLRPQVKSFRQFGDVVKTLVPFFKHLKSKFSNSNHQLCQDSSDVARTSSNIPECDGSDSGQVSSRAEESSKSYTDNVTVEDNAAAFDLNCFTSYKNSDTDCTKKSSSLFDSLYKKEDDNGIAVQIHSSNNTSSGEFKEENVKIPKLRRKLRVVPNTVDIDAADVSKRNILPSRNKTKRSTSSNAITGDKRSSESNCESTSTNSSNSSSAKNVEAAKLYMEKIKRNLPESSFKQFVCIVKSYKFSGLFDDMIKGLAAILTEKESSYPLFAEFMMFIKPQHKIKFDEVCMDLIGYSAIDGRQISGNSLFAKEASKRRSEINGERKSKILKINHELN